jgi:small subunit ribosomal protein S8
LVAYSLEVIEMSMQDPIADLLTRIRNAQMMGIRSLRLPFSGIKQQILRVLEEEGYIDSFDAMETDGKRDLRVELKYYEGAPVIDEIKRVSRPSLRVYKGAKELPLVRGGLGVAIISTPFGVMSDRMARTKNVGGEVICTVE